MKWRDWRKRWAMANKGTYLVCLSDGCGFVIMLDQPGEIPACAKCGGHLWKTLDTWQAKLTARDISFLHALRINPDE